MKKVLIDNCVPLNNGDAALIFGLYKQLKAKKCEVEFSCLKQKEVKKIYPNFVWYNSHIGTIFYRICFKKNLFVFLWKIFIFFKLVVFNNEYKRNEIIISAPGGYIHSYYGIEARMYILYLCKKWLHKQVGIYSQSIGKLNKHDQRVLYKYGKHLNFIFVRDETSYRRIKSYGNFNNIYRTKDAAFLLLDERLKLVKTTKKKVALSVRKWSNEGRSMQVYYQLLNKIVKYLIKNEYEITFLSTCQGLSFYTDDSKVAKDFLREYSYEEGTNIKVDQEYYDLDSLQKKLRTFDFVIGTRLHMCLLSLLNGVPSFNISYEEKGIESFKYLGIEDFVVDFNSKSEHVNEKLDAFLGMELEEKEELLRKVNVISKEQKLIFYDLYSSNFERIAQ
ncbi:polysaccharide pyruvyl transferase family protein [Tetragenococcus koreensis]|uniref:polysaccharide pyruvyl transferase family protein n=1 Tax=Tetragenococcus koreensis TaxID=290335 RepID=UPI001F3058C5|nr:polysaccharide pyruvyl transferase family protein [Tetragenococcus koreensis]MCF1613604.1 polysaccharide pyruvyl transferase family protein [Tetragenococcus koreensis]MCF1623400.1 polysaccharide pyruvyl transferase family protein [Tetragenococcus koreensis]